MPDRHGILGGIFHPNGLRGGGFGETALPIAACAVNELWDKVWSSRRTPKDRLRRSKISRIRNLKCELLYIAEADK